MFDEYSRLTGLQKLNVWGVFASLISLIPILLQLWGAARRKPGRFAHDFRIALTVRSHVVLAICGLAIFIVIFFDSLHSVYDRISLVILCCLQMCLTGSVIVRANGQFLRQAIIKRIDRIRESATICAGIKFDIDLIVAINDFSFSLGHQIVIAARRLIRKHASDLQTPRTPVAIFEPPESDETIVIIGGKTAEDAANLADSIRRALKSELARLTDYTQACEHVQRSLRNPPLTPEECEGIGTLSAGVASYTKGAEALLSDIAQAVKTSKFRGRNKTVIYRRDQEPIIRSDYHAKRRPPKRGN